MYEPNRIPVFRPIKGTVFPIEQVPDEVFASKLLGDGVAILAEEGVVRSPVDGKITLLFPSMHALAIRTRQGLDIMIHIGVDTVELRGEGFTTLVGIGDQVTVGQELIRFDWKKISASHSLLSPVLVTNLEQVEKIEPGSENVLYTVIMKREYKEFHLSGIAISDGIAMGPAGIVRPEYNVNRHEIEDKQGEKVRYRNAIQGAKQEVNELIRTAITRLSPQEVDILSTQELMLDDPQIMLEVLEGIEKQGINAEAVLWDTMNRWIQEFSSMEDSYMRGRAVDLIDVRDRLLKSLEGETQSFTGLVATESILVLDEMPPTLLGEKSASNILGIVTAKGNETSHGSIMARSQGIPMVSGIGEQILVIQPGDYLIVDGKKGLVILNPEPETVQQFRARLAKEQEQARELLVWKDKRVTTKDDFPISIGANIGSLTDTKRAREFGADEIGLFRTEVLFMSYDHWPTEEEQLEYYKKILQEMDGRTVIFRVLDIGGDKPLPYFSIEEQNPFLGYRGVRVLFDREEMFRSQLRALYRSSEFGSIKIMFPMIHSMEEWQHIQSICGEVETETGLGKVPLGVMVETPAAALIIDSLVEEVAFISIGTNDLIQYTLAVDRQNDRVKDLYDPLHPAILKLISSVIQAAREKDVWVGVCGELAGDEKMLPLWIALGINELSVNPNRVLLLKKKVSEITRDTIQKIADQLHQATTKEKVNKIINELQINCQDS